MKKYRNILLLAAFVFLALIISGCTGETTNDPSDEGDDSNSGGRIIVPDADWDPVEPEDEEPVDGADTDDESTGTTDDDSDASRVVEPEINIEVYLDGELYESGTAVYLFHDQTVEALIKIRATGSELSFYQVMTTEQTQRPFEGRLSGYEDDVTYIFTYNYVTWGEGGLTIIVTNRRGDAHMQNVLIIPVEIPGFDPGR
ncbi:hypothetical protein KAU08_07950 [bacterium]|nr:hypothetical protein [bacterium]